jgi:resuscitation-promoting factor RpfA
MRHARYRGRHRKPSTTNRLTAVGAVGVGTVAASILAPAAAAHAATDVQWERVAHCESGGNWHDNTGNGYYGGLQFSASTWSSYDTNHFANRADLATREQQMGVADRVLARQGWGAWPVCSHDAGAPGPAHTHHHAHHKVSAHHAKVSHRTHYRVKRGDTLTRIADKLNIKGGWKALYRANHHVIGSNPGQIRVGEKLTLPTTKS